MKILAQLFARTALALALALATSMSAQAAPLTLVATTPLPDVKGGDFDHFAVDMASSLMYVPTEVDGTIEVFGLPDGRHLASLPNLAISPHKLVLAKRGRELYIADGGDADLKVVETASFKLVRSIPMAAQPDTGVVDEKTGIFYVGNGGVKSHLDKAYISMVSLADGAVLGRIAVPAGRLKAMVVDPATQRLFVNMRDKRQVGVIDLKTRTLTATWPVPGPGVNSAMAFDAETNRLFIGSRKPGTLFVLDARNGKVIESLPIVDVSDEMIVDQPHRRLYITGVGGLDVVVRKEDGHYAVEQHIDTLGGKTAVYLPSLKKLYVVHTKGPQAAQAGLQIFDVN
jgi:DNA-binding beta-propeller fold protein YncE